MLLVSNSGKSDEKNFACASLKNPPSASVTLPETFKIKPVKWLTRKRFSSPVLV